ncbi:LysR family transcriptional regulator [Stella humosa]|uniref:LysR family transcriptional regulator n=1 Tax=Stella humosa TaxID=94 RepID=UPI0018D64A85|nr:LysR family transcriptional regulator [Stella humosa]
MIDPKSLNRLVYFVAVVETRAFTRAAERLGVTKAVVSQQVARLEAELGTSLLVRTTRRVEPTEAGRMLHARAATILREAEDAFAELDHANSAPRGTLRLTAPTDYGTITVVPAVTEFLRRHPACRAEIRLNDRRLDLQSGDLDLSIRVGWLADSSMHARRIGHFEQVLVAAPDFADDIAKMSAPGDLATVPFVANLALRDPLAWQFARGDGEREGFQASAAMAIDTTQAVHAAVLCGAGLSVLPDFLVAADLAAGRLVEVLPQWRLPSGGIHAVFPTARFRPSRVGAFVDLLAQRIARQSQTGQGPAG